MDMDALEFVRRKLDSLLGYLGELEEELPGTVQDYLSAGRVLQGYVERRCQVAIESAIDANDLLLSALGHAAPGSARQGFEAVRQLEALDDETGRRFTDTFVGFRNRLVHDYEQVDQRIVYHTARLLVACGRQYAAGLAQFLNSRAGGDAPAQA